MSAISLLQGRNRVEILSGAYLDYALIAAIKHGSHYVVTAMGSFPGDPGPGLPFTLYIADRP